MGLSLGQPLSYASTALALTKGGGVQYVNARAPRSTDDTACGYVVGDFWNYSGTIWQCTGATNGSAVWTVQTNPGTLLASRVATPLAVWGVRLEVSGYSGPCLELTATVATATVTRDIGFTSGAVDVAAADAFAATADPGTTVNISKVYDQTGGGRHLVQATRANMPVWINLGRGNLRGIVSTTGPSQNVCRMLTASGTSLDLRACSILDVSRQPTTAAGTQWQIGDDTTGPQRDMVFSSALNSATNGLISNAFTSGFGNMPMFVPKEAANVMLQVYASGAANFTYQVNDNVYTSAAPIGPSYTAVPGFTIGGNRAGTLPGDKEWFSLALYQRQLSAADISAAKIWAFSTFNVLPQVRDSLSIAGDSRVAGTGSTNFGGWPWQMAPLLVRPYRIYANGLPGVRLDTIHTNRNNFTGRNFTPGATRRVALIVAGINDVNQNADGPTILARATTLAASERTAGAGDVIISTILPWGNANGTQETNRNAANLALLAGVGAVFDRSIDMAASPTIGPFAATSNLTYYVADKLHLTNASNTIQAQTYAAGINTLEA